MTTTHPRDSRPAVSRLASAFSLWIGSRVLGTVFLLVVSCALLHGQTAHFGYALSSLGSGFGNPTYAAFDPNGNLYVTDEGNSAVYELTIASGYSTVKTISTQFGIPTGIAVDAAGNVFVTDQSVAGVYELTAASNFTNVITIGSGFSNPNGVAVDSNGNVFVADTLHNQIKEVLAVNGSIPANNPTINVLGGSYNRPTSVALDSNGNVFVADLFNSQVKEILATGGYTTVNVIGSGFSYPGGVSIDANNNLYVADSGHGSVKELLASGGYTTINTLVGSLPYSAGVVVNSEGNVFIASFSGSKVFELTLNGAVGFGSLPVANPTAEVITLHFVFDTGGTVGTPEVRMLGAANKDFTDDGTGTCTTNGNAHTYNAGDTCTVVVTFIPKFSGNRYGAVTLTDNGGAPIAVEYLYGIGVGPQVSFAPVLSTLTSGFDYPNGIAMDGDNNIYVADQYNNEVKEILAAGGYVTVNSIGSGFNNPVGVAVDGAGNVFVADTYNNEVKEIVAGGSIQTLGSGFNAPNGVAVDRNGNVFVADSMNGEVKEIPAAGGYTTVVSLANGLAFPIGIAVDPSGNVFVADVGSGLVSEIVAAGGYTTVRSLGSGFNQPAGVALDDEGNLFVSDFGNNAIKELTVADDYTTIRTISSDLDGPIGNAVDGEGNIFVANSNPNTLVELSVTTPPSLTFASTAVGSTSGDSPKTIALTNSGNAPLTFEVPGSGANPTLGAGFSYDGSSTCPRVTAGSSAASLAAQTSCQAAINFTPVSPGSITGMLTFTDNAMNAPGPTYTTQSIGLSGPATPGPVVATTAAASTVLTQNHAATSFIPVTATGGSGTYTYSVSPALPAGLSFSTSTGAVSGTPTAASAATTYTVTVSSPNATSGTATFSLTVNAPVTAAAAIASTTLSQNHPATAFTPVTGSGGTSPLTYGVSPALPQGLAFSSSTGTVSGTPTATSPAATYTVTVTDSNGATATATFSLAVSPAAPTATATVLTSSNNAPAFGTSVVLTATVTPASTDTPAGTVNFYAGTTLLGTSAINGSGVATLSATFPQGSSMITAVYSGSSRFAGSTSNGLSVTALAATSLTLSATPATQLFNNPIVLSAQVTSATSGALSGTVTFLDGTTTIANVPVAMNGQASYSVSSLGQGSHSLSASYSGDGNFQPSTSTGTGISITVGNINLNLGGDQNQTVLPGGTATYTFPLSPVVTPTFLYDVKLTATGLPPGATYTISPASIPAGSGTIPVTLVVQTAKGTGILSPPATGGTVHALRALSTTALGVILPFFGLKRFRRRLGRASRTLVLLLFSVMSLWATVALSGCGSSGFFGHTATSGNYTITVTATSADLVRTSTVQLTIQ